MTIQIVNSDTFGSITLSQSSDGVYIKSGVTIYAQYSSSIYGESSNHRVFVEGTIFNEGGSAIWLGADENTIGQYVYVGNNGSITSSNIAISTFGTFSKIINHGTINSSHYGILIGNGAISGGYENTLHEINNYGSIESVYNAIARRGYDSDDPLIIRNYGYISASDNAFFSDGAIAKDTIINRGTIVGNIEFYGGDDTFDGRGGSIQGKVNGGDGNDYFFAETGMEYFDGGEGSDTLDFTSSSGVVISLAAADNAAGIAFGDRYRNFENVTGSLTGADRISGNELANVLSGNGGKDVLFGKAGDDQLVGGAGNDVLDGGAGADILNGGEGVDLVYYISATSGLRADLSNPGSNTGDAAGDTYAGIEGIVGSGFNDELLGNTGNNILIGMNGKDILNGAGGSDILRGGVNADTLVGGAANDHFQYVSAGEGGDKILDFSNVAGNNDTFTISAAGFGGGLFAGVLNAAFFQSRADNLAQDADDRFIFRTTDQTLWFDVNGNAAGGLVLIADLQAGASVTAADIIVF